MLSWPRRRASSSSPTSHGTSTGTRNPRRGIPPSDEWMPPNSGRAAITGLAGSVSRQGGFGASALRWLAVMGASNIGHYEALSLATVPTASSVPTTPAPCSVSGRECAGIVLPMETKIDAVGRVVVPKPLRDALGLSAGSTVDISRYGAGLQLVPAGRTARLAQETGVLVATGETVIDDDTVFGLIDAGRR
jgi:AbrB family looped-hinge helix DNA binding protein